MKSESGAVGAPAYYLPQGPSADGAEGYLSTPATAGPWSADAQHGGPPAALLGRALEGSTEPGRTIGRFTMDLLGPIPVGPLSVTSDVLRPGRRARRRSRIRSPTRMPTVTWRTLPGTGPAATSTPSSGSGSRAP
jgi:hypothetical protein